MHEIVQEFYGNTLQTSADLKTDACCDMASVLAWLKPLLARIQPEVLSRYYGCGLVCPLLLAGSTMHDRMRHLCSCEPSVLPRSRRSHEVHIRPGFLRTPGSR